LAFLFHSLLLSALVLCCAGLFLIYLSGLLFCLPLFDRLIDEV
jgi:hypothetical protein